MEQFVLVPFSIYNSKIITTVVTKTELLTYQNENTLGHQVVPLKNDINQKFFAKVDSLVEKLLSSLRIKLSSPKFLLLYGRDTGVSLTYFAKKLRRKNAEVPDMYFTLLDAADITPSLVLNDKGKEKTEETRFRSKNEPRKLQKLYSEGGAAYSSVQILVKTRKSPTSKVRQFVPSKTSWTKFFWPTSKFRRKEPFARFRNEIWCMDLAFVDQLARDNNGVKILLVRQDMFDRKIDAIGKKTKDWKETLETYLKLITEKYWPKRRVRARNEVCWRIRKILCDRGYSNTF